MRVKEMEGWEVKVKGIQGKATPGEETPGKERGGDDKESEWRVMEEKRRQ